MSIMAVVKVIESKHSQAVIQGIWVCNRSIAIKLLIAYPCRLARRIFAHRSTRNLELDDMDAMLRLQTRKAVVRDVDLGILIVDLAQTADTTQAPPIPADPAKDALVFGDAVAVDDHINFLPNK